MTLQGVLSGVPDLGKLTDKLSWAIAPFAFVEQLTGKERAAGILNANRPIQENAARIIDIISGRIAGVSLLGIVKAPRTFKMRNFILNKYMGFWILGELAQIIVSAAIPALSRVVNPIVKITRIAVIPGSIGAVFDDPVTKRSGGFSGATNTGHTDITSRSMMIEHALIA